MTLQFNKEELNSTFNSMAHCTATSKIDHALTAASTVNEILSNLNGTFQKTPTADKDVQTTSITACEKEINTNYVEGSS